ncbi:DedA family protein [Nocardioides luteus]|uniref:Cytochrome o ubiquinol oxidase n=3 Tax=Nocardioides luteus TaxID=1844 RepID=A0ABQ5SX02_9ACTN|nr:VTT domain-containing protein [Nocardioides luteus]GLJ68683.1 cytochrome o ubiquinol oxidase [Nocardioides luteus]
MMAGLEWMSPDFLLATFGEPLFWISLVIIFVECGLFFPFLPGDSLLIALGIFIATGKIDIFFGPPGLEIVIAMLFFLAAAFAGNVTGYEIGRKIGPRLYQRNGRLLKQSHLDQTREFFDKHGSKALVIGRFIAFIRTYVTVVAGVTHMDRRKFYVWSLVGGALWVLTITLFGFFVGARWPWLADNIDYLILLLFALAFAPAMVEWFRRRRTAARLAADGDTSGSDGPSLDSAVAPRAPADDEADHRLERGADR